MQYIIYAAVITKPLQLINSLNISTQLSGNNEFRFYISKSFPNAELVVKSLNKLNSNKKFKFYLAKSPYLLAAMHRPHALFIDSDVGILKWLKLNIIKITQSYITINVYEEGIGSYRNDIYPDWKKRIFKIFGIGWAFGESYLTKNIYLYNKIKYDKIFRNNKSIKFRISFTDTLERFNDLLTEAFNTNETLKKDFENQTGDILSIYLTSWEINHDFINEINKFPGDVLIKLHPHINLNNAKLELKTTKNISSSYCPAEILINEALAKYNEVYIYHHGSSVENYMQNSRLHFINLFRRQSLTGSRGIGH